MVKKHHPYIEGMSCGMCEFYIADTIRHASPCRPCTASCSSSSFTLDRNPVEEAVIKKRPLMRQATLYKA